MAERGSGLTVDQTIARVAEQLGFQAARIWPQVVMVTWVTSLFWVIADPVIFFGSLIGIVRIWRFGWTQVNRANDEYDEAKKADPRGYTSRLDHDPTSAVLVCLGAAFL